MVFPAWRGPGCGLWPYPGYAAGASPRVGVTAGLRNGYFQRGGAPDAAFGLIRATRLARRHALSATAGLRNGISSVAGSRMRPLALSGLRGWRVATRGRYRWAAQRRFSAWRGPRGGLWAFPGYPAWPWARPGGYGREAERRCARERR